MQFNKWYVLFSHVKLVSHKSLVYEAGPQSKFPTHPTASKPYIARSDCAYVIEQ
jgi:hypothetical protein